MVEDYGSLQFFRLAQLRLSALLSSTAMMEFMPRSSRHRIDPLRCDPEDGCRLLAYELRGRHHARSGRGG
jgi:hypothetical protein